METVQGYCSFGNSPAASAVAPRDVGEEQYASDHVNYLGPASVTLS